METSNLLRHVLWFSTAPPLKYYKQITVSFSQQPPNTLLNNPLTKKSVVK